MLPHLFIAAGDRHGLGEDLGIVVVAELGLRGRRRGIIAFNRGVGRGRSLEGVDKPLKNAAVGALLANVRDERGIFRFCYRAAV